MKRLTALLLTAAVMLSAAGCEDEPDSSSSVSSSVSTESEKETLSGKYHISDIDGFADKYAAEGGVENFIKFKKDGTFEWILLNELQKDREYYKKYGYECKDTGVYDLSDDTITINVDRIDSIEEYRKMFPCNCFTMSDGEEIPQEDDYVQKILDYYNSSVQEYEFGIADKDEKLLYYVDNPHTFRCTAYSDIALAAARETCTSLYGFPDDKYSFVSSYGSLCSAGADPDKTAEEMQELINEYADLSGYTPEEGFTENFDISKHNWLIVVRGDSLVYAVVFGEDLNSDIFGAGNYWYFNENDRSSEPLEEDIYSGFESMNDVYQYYKDRNNQ